MREGCTPTHLDLTWLGVLPASLFALARRSLRRLSTANHHFIGYGTWDSFDAYMDHFMTKHVRKLRE